MTRPFALFRIIASAALFLAGCATQAQREAQAIRANGQSADQTFLACSQAVADSPDFAPLRLHMPTNVNNATLQQMTETAFASDEEINALLLVQPRGQACRSAYLAQITQTTPTVVPIFLQASARNENTLIDLIHRKLSWGDYVRTLKASSGDLQAQLTAAFQRINAGLQQSNDAELARRQAAYEAAAQRQTEIQTEVIKSLNRPPVQTSHSSTCMVYGDTVQCYGN